MEVKRDEITQEQWDEMKQIAPGTIARGKEIGKKDHYSKFIWTICEQCDKGRWLRLDKPKSKLCRKCTSQNIFIQICTPHPPNWKGGRRSNHGYILILKPEHPRADKAGYVPEHILIWEQVHNKPLPQGWVIHHLNGIKADNRPENFLALPSRKHHDVLAAKAQRIRELEAKVKLLEKALDSQQIIWWTEN